MLTRCDKFIPHYLDNRVNTVLAVEVRERQYNARFSFLEGRAFVV